jgi:hypothetical protein
VCIIGPSLRMIRLIARCVFRLMGVRVRGAFTVRVRGAFSLVVDVGLQLRCSVFHPPKTPAGADSAGQK